ncbi:MAG: 1-pyrroline-5-carboxylate dehydrogenase, partial [Chitinophagaceae bacterium]
MKFGDFHYPMPANEPVLSYAPGTAERKLLKDTITAFKKEALDIPMYIGSEEIRTGKKVEIRAPHETAHLLGHFHAGDESHVDKAIEAALAAKEKWQRLSW